MIDLRLYVLFMEGKDGQVYAPVLIPTISRFEHLKRCVHSLRENPYAKYTELYISIDFPLDEKYIEGNQNIKRWLSEGVEGFSAVHIFVQDVNRGVLGNGYFLMDEAQKDHECFIYSEDDNYYSPCFLEFMNRMLENYKDDQDILSVYGNKPITTTVPNEDIFKVCDFSAYGYGSWFTKFNKMKQDLNRQMIEEICCSKKELKSLEKQNGELVLACSSALLRKEALYQTRDGSIPYFDMMFALYYCIKNKFMICSNFALVKNDGYDGSGTMCDIREDMPFISDEPIEEKKYYCKVLVGEEKTYEMTMGLHGIKRIKMWLMVRGARIKIQIWKLISKHK